MAVHEAMRETTRDDRPLGELFGHLAQNMALLVRQEADLAKAEVGQKVSRVTRHATKLAAGGIVAYVGTLVLVAALVLGLADLLDVPVWATALIVGVLIAGTGAFLLRRGLDELKRMNMTPRRTVNTLKDDLEWAKELRK